MANKFIFDLQNVDGETVQLPRNNILYMFNHKSAGVRCVAVRGPDNERVYQFATNETLQSLKDRFGGEFVRVDEPCIESQESYERRVAKARARHAEIRANEPRNMDRSHAMDSVDRAERDRRHARQDEALRRKTSGMKWTKRSIHVVRDAIRGVSTDPYIGHHIVFKAKTGKMPIPADKGALDLSLSKTVGMRQHPEVLIKQEGLRLVAV